MTDSRDKPEIETLSYEPASAPPAVGGKNTPLIKPETRVNLSEVIGQHPELCNCIDCKPTIAELEKAIGSGNELDILPNGQVRKKIHLAEQPPNNCDCLERPKIHTIECVSKPEQPNQNLMIIEEIEGLMSQVNDKLESLWPNGKPVYVGITVPKDKCISLALEEIDLFQETTLFELKKAFE